VNAALVAGCCAGGAALGPWLPVAVTPSDDGTIVVDGPRAVPHVALRRPWGRAMILATAALWGAFAARVGWSWPLPAYLALSAGLVALTVIDLRDQLLPRRLILAVGILVAALLAVAAVGTGAGAALVRAGLSAAGAYLVFFALRVVNPRALGGGDVNLAALLGLALGWYSVRTVLLGLAAGMVLAALFALGALAARRVRTDSALSYGPFLIAGAVLILLVAPDGRLFG
jgi:leader peptidase (prepilin peptidase) / N-methyltransferase